ncbi:DNA polymerase III subunits gamma and tau [hydrothermal vent metagenome]|uniref:DNA-directed DNA polymerase n=1 Tax=hydrothermal vent metagenome TaxID=652676 RepID=A0A3B0YSI3_9ZZZZ
MSYQVLATRWRPAKFDELVGQEHVLRALTNALDNDRVHHAFLFTGTRGVGKTTIARILAKSLNCEQGMSATPCGQCSACVGIDQGRFVDLIEVDAASRTKVEDTRELLDNVQYAPTQGRYKVYLIDEVHMLSTHSFNALLKTLEEPPPHVKFLLATTDPQKLPVTILSRCLQYNLKRLTIDQIQQQLLFILEQEKIKYETKASLTIARAADGSMRDGLSLLDQAIAYCDFNLQTKDVQDMLGTIEQNYIHQILLALSRQEAPLLMKLVSQIAERAPDFDQVLSDIISLLHRLAMVQQVPEALDEWVEDSEQLLELAQLLKPEDVQLYYQIAVNGRADLQWVPDQKSGVEMLLLRMLAFRPVDVSTSGAEISSPSGQHSNAAANESRSGSRQSQAVMSNEQSNNETLSQRQRPVAGLDKVGALESGRNGVERESATSSRVVSEATPMPEKTITDTSDWKNMIQSMQLLGPVRQLANYCSYEGQQEGIFRLALDPKYEAICSEDMRSRLEQAIKNTFGKELTLKMNFRGSKIESPVQTDKRKNNERHQEAVDSLKQDSTVKEIQNMFDAEISPDMVRPND